MSARGRMTDTVFRSLDDWLAHGSKPSDLKPGDRIIVQVDMGNPPDRHVIEYWPFRVVQAPSAGHVLVESLPKKHRDRLITLTLSSVLIDRDRCLGPWRAASHVEGEPTCELDDCLDFSHYTRTA